MAKFDWPWQYSFPPFFTLQPNLDTRQKQLDAWTSLILNYYRHTKQYSLDVTEALASPLFTNKAIDIFVDGKPGDKECGHIWIIKYTKNKPDHRSGRLSQDAVYAVLEELRKKGNVEWTDKTRQRCLVMWRTPEEWGKLIYQWASDNGMVNSVCTLYELSQGDDTVNQEFHGLEDWLLKRSLETLEKQRKAELMSFDGSEGIKFFS